jgi:heme-degrading monooxygenase HmoA
MTTPTVVATARAYARCMPAIEITTFRLRADADEGAFVAEDARVQTEVAYRQPGLLRRTLARADDGSGWAVVTVWQDLGSARGASSELPPQADAATVVTARYAALD